MDFINRFLWIFSAPVKVFDHIAENKVSWWQPWIWLSIISAVTAFLSAPAQRVVVELNPGNMPAEQLQRQLEMMDKYGNIQLIAIPIVVLVIALIVGGLSYILVSILSEKANFKKFFTIYFYGGIVASLAGVIGAIMVKMKGLETIRAPEDAQFSISLGFLAPPDGLLIKSILSGIEFFSIWALVIIAMGLMRVFDMPRKHAIYCVIPMWVLGVILILVNNLVTGLN
jgi:hypothetical protein